MDIAIQGELATALLRTDAPTPSGIVGRRDVSAARRFSVYRNNVVAGLVRALETRFPVIARLVGGEFFEAMARAYVTEDPPRSPILFRYGGGFPAFIDAFPPAAPVPFLSDVARLEFARGRAFHAADTAPLCPRAFASLDADSLGATGVVLHPSVELLSSRYPIVSIWRAHQTEGEPRLEHRGAEAALITRPAFEVEVHLLPPGGYAFLTALQRGESFARAAATASGEAADFDPVANLALLVEARIAIRFASARLI